MRRPMCANYGQNAGGKWVRNKAFRSCDYTPEGHLKEFDSKEAFLEFEKTHYRQGEVQAHYEKKPRTTVPKSKEGPKDCVRNIGRCIEVLRIY